MTLIFTQTQLRKVETKWVHNSARQHRCTGDRHQGPTNWINKYLEFDDSQVNVLGAFFTCMRNRPHKRLEHIKN